MKATEIYRTRIIESEISFIEIVIWMLPEPLKGSEHSYKYRMAYVVDEVCVVRLDNEAGKGDHLHFEDTEVAYKFVSVDQLFVDFQNYIHRWNDENGHT